MSFTNNKYDEGSALLVPPAPALQRMTSMQRLKLKMREFRDDIKEDFVEELEELQSYPFSIWRTLVRFHKHTNVLEWSALAFLLAYAYGLLFGMYINGWSITTSTYFFAYTLATIGYDYSGDSSNLAYGLLALYVFVSVLACSLLLGLFVAAMTNLSDMQVKHSFLEEKRRKRRAAKGGHQIGTETKDHDIDSTPETSLEARSRIEVRVALEAIIASLFRFFLISAIGTIGLIYLDQDFTVVKAILFTMQTVATVGYGTTSLDTPVAKWFIVCFIPFGCGSWAACVVACSRLPLVILKRSELQEHIIALKGSLSNMQEQKNKITAHAAWALLRSHIHLNMHSFSNVKNAAGSAESTNPASIIPPKPSSTTVKNTSAGEFLQDLGHQKHRHHQEHSLNQQEFIIHWLLATNQVSLQDVLDARDFFHTLDATESGVLHLPTYMDDEDPDDCITDDDDDYALDSHP